MSSNDTTRAVFSGMSQGEADFSAAAKTLQTELSDLESTLSAKLAEWDGEAREAYYVYQAKWHSAAQDIQNIIAALGIAIGNANSNYQAAEKANHGLWV